MTEIDAIRTETAAMLQRDREHWSAVRDAAHGVALIEGAERSPFADNPNTCSHGYRFENGLCPTVGCGAGDGTTDHAGYRDYLCSMYDHGCECLALDFDRWLQVVVADDLRTDLQRAADFARDGVRRQPYPDRHVYALGYLASAVRRTSQAVAVATADGVEQGISARVPL